MKTLTKIDPMSAAKLAAIAGVIWGLIVGALILTGISIAPYLGRFYMAYQTQLPMTGSAIIITLPIAYGVTGFISAYIGAMLYNFVAKQIGGVKVDLK